MKSFVSSFAVYGTQGRKQLEALDIWRCRRMWQFSWRDGYSNEEALKRIKPLLSQIQTRSGKPEDHI